MRSLSITEISSNDNQVTNWLSRPAAKGLHMCFQVPLAPQLLSNFCFIHRCGDSISPSFSDRSTCSHFSPRPAQRTPEAKVHANDARNSRKDAEKWEVAVSMARISVCRQSILPRLHGLGVCVQVFGLVGIC